MTNKYITIALVVVVLAGAGSVVWFTKGRTNPTQPASSVMAPDANAAVATLHGGATTITRAQLDTKIDQLSKNPQIKVPNASDTGARTTFEHAVLDQMIGEMLVFDEAQKEGFTTDDVAIDKQLGTITAQYASTTAFEAALIEAKLSKESLRENIRHALISNQYYEKIAKEHPVTVSEEEIKASYDQSTASQNPKPPFKEVTGQIKAQIEQQKLQEVLKGIIDGLRQAADVKVLI